MDSSLYVLFAEDDVEDHLIMSQAFTELDFSDRAKFVVDGEKLLKYLETQLWPCLIVLDLNMPLLNGVETLRILKADMHYKHIPVIILSTSVNERDKEECLKLGALEYFVKPSTFNECLHIVSHFCDICKKYAINN